MAILTESQRRRKAFFKRFRLYAIISGTLLLLVAVAALLLRAPWWTGMTLVIKGVEPETQNEIIKDLKLQISKVTRSTLLGTDHYFAWPEDFPYAARAASTITIEKKLWDKEIVFTVAPREQYAVWCVEQNTQPECSWIDRAGIPFARAPVSEGQLVRTIYARGTVSNTEGDKPVISNETFAIIKTTLDALSRLDLTISKITYLPDLSELHVQNDTGTTILISTRFDPTPTALPAIKRFIAKPGLKSLEYINLTVENRAFVKYR